MKVYCTAVEVESNKDYEIIRRFTVDNVIDKEPEQKKIIQAIKKDGYVCASFSGLPNDLVSLNNTFVVIRDNNMDEKTAVQKGLAEFLSKKGI